MAEGAISEETATQEVKAKLSTREIVLICAVAVCAIVAVVGIALNCMNAVPSDAAAKVDGSYMTEQRVADWISEYRGTYGLTDDTDFADSLSSQSKTVSSFRIEVINQLAVNDMVEKRAKELGISVSDDEVQAQYDAVVGSISSGDNSLFQQTISAMGLTEQSLKDRYRANLLQEKLLEAEVATPTPSESDVLSYITSNLAGTTQMHVYRAVFNGSDKSTKSQECYKALTAAKAAGTLNATTFAEIAKKYSDETNVSTTGGSLGWTGSGVFPSDISDALETMSVGDLTSVLTVEDDDNAYEIAYVDTSYTFPASGTSFTLSSLNMPSELSDVVTNAVALSLWQTDCNTYLDNLLAKAKITYYPVPDNASYNVTKG